MGLDYYKTIGEIQAVWNAQQKKAFELQPSIEKTAAVLLKTHEKLVRNFLKNYSFGRAHKALNTAKKLTAKIKSEVYK